MGIALFFTDTFLTPNWPYQFFAYLTSGSQFPN